MNTETFSIGGIAFTPGRDGQSFRNFEPAEGKLSKFQNRIHTLWFFFTSRAYIFLPFFQNFEMFDFKLQNKGRYIYFLYQ